MKELLIIGQGLGAQKTLTRLGSGDRLKGWKTVALPISDLQRRHSLPEVTMIVVRDVDIGSWDELNSVADALAAKQDRSTTPAYFIFSFHGAQKWRPGKAVLNKFLRRFRDPERV